MKDPLVVVLMGGESEEHDVSRRSGAAVVHHLPAAGYVPVPVVVGRDGRWAFPAAEDIATVVPDLPLHEAVRRIMDMRPACVFLAMHGPYGEDGRMQGLCDLMHIPHAGADAVGSAVAIDKWLTKAVYRTAGIPTPDAVLVERRDLADAGVLPGVVRRLGLPVVVKTPRMGSSFGVSIARDEPSVAAAVDAALRMDVRVVCEQYRRGRELTVPVLEDPVSGEPAALPVIEVVVHKHDFFDYESKYDPALSDEVCPADIPPDVAIAVQDLGVRSHRALMLSGFSRTDFIWDAEGLWTLETNTIPGMTDASLFPKAVKAAGGTFAGMLKALIERARQRR